MLTIAVSSRALFSLEDGNRIFETEGEEAFDAYMREKETTPLKPGAAFPLVRKLLALNTSQPPDRPDRVAVVLMSRNSPQAGLRVMNSVQHYGLGIEQAVFSKGSDRFRYFDAMGVHLFLSANAPDVRAAISQGVAAATILPKETELNDDREVRIAFDGDAVLFSDEADEAYRTGGLRHFRDSELSKAKTPLGDGPFRKVLSELHKLQNHYPNRHDCPVKVALVTARGMPAHERVLTTLRSWDVNIDEIIFAAGLAKGPILKAFGADIFFDDGRKNIESALEHDVSSGHVPFGLGGLPPVEEAAAG